MDETLKETIAMIAVFLICFGLLVGLLMKSDHKHQIKVTKIRTESSERSVKLVCKTFGEWIKGEKDDESNI